MPRKFAYIVRKRIEIKEGDILHKIKVIKIYYDKDGNKIKAKVKTIDIS